MQDRPVECSKQIYAQHSEMFWNEQEMHNMLYFLIK